MTIADDTRSIREESGSNYEVREVFSEHERTFRSFITLVTWSVIHVGLILVGLYFVTIGQAPYFGALFWLLALVLMGYGMIAAGLKSKTRH